MTITVEILKLNTVNKSGNIYPAEVVQKAINAWYNENGDIKTFYGMLSPTMEEIKIFRGESVDLSRVSHQIIDLQINNDSLMAEIQILENLPYGKILQSLYDPNKIKFSATGTGIIRDDDHTVDGYKLLAVDAYIIPSKKYETES